MAGTWLEPSTVKAVLGTSLSGVLEDIPFAAAVEAVRVWVEDHREDLWSPATETTPAAFVPTETLVYGSSLLAHRWYSRRRAPLGSGDDAVGDVLREDVDLARMLGVSTRWTFGAPS